jgi:hypothetical protein
MPALQAALIMLGRAWGYDLNIAASERLVTDARSNTYPGRSTTNKP